MNIKWYGKERSEGLMNDLFPPSTLTENLSNTESPNTENYKRRSIMNRKFSTCVKRLHNLFSVPRIRRATIAAAVIMISQQLCGVNIFSFYSGTILSHTDPDDIGAVQKSKIETLAAVRTRNKNGLWLGWGVWLITML
jgi:hypothetical protein